MTRRRNPKGSTARFHDSANCTIRQTDRTETPARSARPENGLPSCQPLDLAELCPTRARGAVANDRNCGRSLATESSRGVDSLPHSSTYHIESGGAVNSSLFATSPLFEFLTLPADRHRSTHQTPKPLPHPQFSGSPSAKRCPHPTASSRKHIPSGELSTRFCPENRFQNFPHRPVKADRFERFSSR